MVYGWRTEKTATGYVWQIYSVGYQIPLTVIRSGACATRAQAMARAKRNVMPFRRASKQEAA